MAFRQKEVIIMDSEGKKKLMSEGYNHKLSRTFGGVHQAQQQHTPLLRVPDTLVCPGKRQQMGQNTV